MIGTPQKRWRETHQSGRLSIISYMRSSPHDGIHFTAGNLRERFAGAQRLLPVVLGWLHADEPLLGGAEDHRVVAAPAVRIGVLVVVVAEQRAAIREKLHDDRVGAENIFAFVFRQTFEVHAAIVEGRISFETVFLSGVEVVGAVSRRGVDDAATLVERDVLCKDTRDLKRQKWMLEFHPSKSRPLKRARILGLA